MASGTMREPVVSSPQPAVTLQSGSAIDENQNSSRSPESNKTENESQPKTKEESNHLTETEGSSGKNRGATDLSGDGVFACKICSAAFPLPRDLERHMSYHKQKTPYLCKFCDSKFATSEQLNDHLVVCGNKEGDDCSNHSEDCYTSNIRNESNISTNLSGPKGSESKSESFESDESFRAIKSLRSARRQGRKECENKRKSDSDSESPVANRRKMKNVNNNDYSDDRYRCPVCDGDFPSWSVLQVHVETDHPEEDGKKYETRKKLAFDSPKSKKSPKSFPRVIGFSDMAFTDFSSGKFPLIAKTLCEESLHLSKDEISFDCPRCGRGFPCDRALDIHLETCEPSEKKLFPKTEKKNKRKSTPKFHPQHSATSDSDDYMENVQVNVADKQRDAFFSSLDLRNTEKSPSVKSEDETEKKPERSDLKSDLADIQSIISVTNIPGIGVKSFASVQDNKTESEDKNSSGLNVHVNNGRSSPGSYSGTSLSSPNFSVLNLISPNYSGNDLTEEEAQDCFAAECRRMKLRGEFPCKLCTAVFPNLRALKGHNRVHISVANGTPNSPYRCNICTYSSLDKATLVRHMRSHNGDRPYECAMCNYAFTTKANCERHLRNRHSKMTRDEVKSSIIYHPSEDPINDSDYQKTSENNKKNLEKPKEKSEFPLPINLKINLVGLKEKSAKDEDLFQSEHRELLKNMKNEEESNKTETGTMTEDVETEKSEEWSYEDNEEALDLRTNKEKDYESDSSDVPQDLSKKEETKEFNNNVEEKPIKQETENYLSQYYDQKPNLDVNGLVKMYSNMYPTLNITQIHQIILLNFPGILQRLHNFPFPQFLMPSPLFSNANNYVHKNVQKEILGLQLSGGNILDEKNLNMTMSEKLQFFQQQALAEIMLKREKDRLANEYYGKSPQTNNDEKRINDFIKRNANEYFTETDKKAFNEILTNRRNDEEKKEQVKISSTEKINDNRNSSVKMVIKNGVLMPKQKQRRYRTERPFSCEHCSARFTLRSNMERHIKQQHPQYWTQKSRSNVGTVRRNDQNHVKSIPYNRDYDPVPDSDYLKRYELGKPVSVSSRDTSNTSGGELKWSARENHPELVDLSNGEKETKRIASEGEQEGDEDEDDDEAEQEGGRKVHLVIDEEKTERDDKKQTERDRLKILMNVSEYLNMQKESDEESEKTEAKENQPQDLASVSKMLDDAVTQTQAFQKYFREEDAKKEGEESKRAEEGERSEEEEGLIAGSTSSDENSYRSESETNSRNGKKKSAYSLAPNRVSCPYCFRKFPWTSSLRRHVLTHTGQKPFKCTHCPLLFTTKSNCDRHLLRKHGREALIASSGQTDNHDGIGNVGSGGAQNSIQNANYTMRNVPERPYKCNQCPSSTFSTLSNLNKHLTSKHHSQQSQPQILGQCLDVSSESCNSDSRLKTMNSQGPPNVTVSSNFPHNVPRNLSVVPQYGEQMKMANKSPFNGKSFPLNVPSIRIHDFGGHCNEIDKEPSEETRSFRKRSSGDETEACDKKRTSPDLSKSVVLDDQEVHRNDLMPIPPSELPFKCHLCECSFGERNEALDHIRCQHPSEFQLLVSKGALETNTDEERHPHDDNEEVLDSTRGRFPDYANRKVMCAFCMRRFWSAEDLRRHMRTHTGERPFSCDVCQRRFTLKHSMLRHRKKHNAHDEILVGSDEEHHSSFQLNNNNNNNNTNNNNNNNISVTMTTLHKSGETEGNLRRTILHQTLTRCDDSREDLRQELKIGELDAVKSPK